MSEKLKLKHKEAVWKPQGCLPKHLPYYHQGCIILEDAAPGEKVWVIFKDGHEMQVFTSTLEVIS